MQDDQSTTTENSGNSANSPLGDNPTHPVSSTNPQAASENTAHTFDNIANTVNPESNQEVPSLPTNSIINSTNPTQNAGQNVVTAPHTPKKNGGKKVIATIFGVLFILGAVIGGVYLTQRPSFRTGEAIYKACPLLQQEGRTIVILNNNFPEGEVCSYPVGNCKDTGITKTTNIPAGLYNVRLVSYDDHSAGNKETQPYEQYYLTINNTSLKTRATSDLPDDQDWLTETVNKKLAVGSPITSVTPKHNYPNGGNTPNSIWPVCAAFDKIDMAPTPTTPVDPTPTTPVDPTPTTPVDPTPTTPVDPTPTVPETDARCSDVIAYNTSWVELSQAQLSQLDPDTTIRFTVLGTATSGTFDKARFSVNSASLGETTLRKPEADEFYIEYTIPENISSFNVSAEIHHSELGWF